MVKERRYTVLWVRNHAGTEQGDSAGNDEWVNSVYFEGKVTAFPDVLDVSGEKRGINDENKVVQTSATGRMVW